MLTHILRSWNEMSLYRKIRRVISIGLIALGVWALTPYLYNRKVNEDFPVAASQSVASAAPALASGMFVDGLPGHHAAGRAAIYAAEGGARTLRLEDFSVTNGPDLFVVLSPSADPNKEGVGENYVRLEALKGNQGSQNYELGADLDLGKYRSVAIWCRSFNVVFGYAPLAGSSAQAAPVMGDAAVMEANTGAAMAGSEAVQAPAVASDAAMMAQPAVASDAAMMAQPTAAPQAAPAGPVALQTGTFIDGPVPGDKAIGKATIYQLADGSRTLRLEDFDATNGPDLFVVLSPNANPAADGIGAAAMRLAALKGNQGNQNYALAADVDLGQYKSVVIWCRAFNVVFGYATLAEAK